MYISLLMILLGLTTFGNANSEFGCKPFAVPNSDHYFHVTCKGNFSEMENLKLYLKNISETVTVFHLQDVLLDVLPSDVFHHVPKPEVRKVMFENVSLELISIPELGDPPLKSIGHTVKSLEIYSSSKVFAWDFPSLELKHLENLIIEDSRLIAISVPFFFWQDLRFVQIQNSSLRWMHKRAFKGNKKLTILSLAHNEISFVKRTMFPKPAEELYSLDLSFNRLLGLPHDMFSDMNALQELKLDNNLLSFFDQKLIQPVWDNLSQLWLDGNSILCEHFCWMAERKDKPMFLESSKCKDSNNSIFIDRYMQECTRKAL